MTLDQLGLMHGTDKATQHPVRGHCYTVPYAACFEPIREQPLRVLEIGVGGGPSIRMWLDYFPNAKVFGVDRVRDTNPWNTPHSRVHPRYAFVHGDQSDPVMWKCLKVDYGADWDIVIDDGSHFGAHIIASFDSLWPELRPGGFYAIEDLNCAYYGAPFNPPGSTTQMDFIKSKLEEINRQAFGTGVAWLHFSKELAIFKKV